MTQLPQELPIPASVVDKLTSVRGRSLKVRIGTAAVAALGVLLTAMAVAMLVDWLATLYDSRWRTVLTTSACVAAGVTLLAWVAIAWRRLRFVDRVADVVDREVPELEQRWSTVTRVAAARDSQSVHPAMYRKVAEEAHAWAPRVEVGQVVRLDGLVRAMLCLTAITAVLAMAVVFDAQRTSVLFQRFWSPGTSISATQISDLPGDVVVGRGESLQISGELTGVAVDQATLVLKRQDGETEEITMAARGGDSAHVTHRLRSIRAPLAYRVRAGDGQSSWHEVVVADRPQLGEVRLQLTPPAYTRQEPKQLTKLPRRVAALEGSRLDVAFRPKHPVVSFFLKIADDTKLALTPDPQGWYRWETTLTHDFSLSPLLTEEHGLSNRRPPVCEIQCRRDKPPTVKILTPGNRLAVRPDDTVPITFVAQDDVGIQSAELVVYDERQRQTGDEPVVLDTIPVPLGDLRGATDVKATIDLDLSRYELPTGSALSFSVRVREDRGQQDLAAVAPPAEEPAQRSLARTTPDTTAAADDNGGSNEHVAASAGDRPTDKQVAAGAPKPAAENSGAAGEPSAEPDSPDEGSPRDTPTETAATPQPTASNRATDDSQPTTAQSQPPPNPMSRLALDVQKEAQSTSSKRLRLTVDEWAGSYDGQQRVKLEMSIAPQLVEIDQLLEKSELLSRSVLDEVDASAPWDNKHDRDVAAAQRHVAGAIKLVKNLAGRTRGTPYAFVGLQLVDIAQAHVEPARRDFWTALQSDDTLRIDSTRNGWQHTSRARELLATLTERFERARQEYKLAESVERIKKMYQVFIEGSLALLRPDGEGGRYSRKMVEFELDEEYLARLKEVMEMRNAMRAELARILADDPRLLRRYLDAQRNRSRILRNELARLAEDQEELNREAKAWATVEEDQRPQMAAILSGRHLEAAQDLAIDAAELHDRFDTWLPLARETEDADLQATTDLLQKIASTTRELSEDSLNYIDQTRQATKRGDVDADAEAEAQQLESVGAILSDAERLNDRFVQLEVLLRQFGLSGERSDVAIFAANRLVETRRMIERTSGWIHQLNQHQTGNYHRAAEVEQYRLAMRTDSLAGKLAGMEQTLANLMQNADSMLPKIVADKARGLLAALDEQAAPNQLAAVYALRRNQMPRATKRQDAALEGLQSAGKLYDEMIEAAIKELDKLPVQDPIASLLDDPTLDELLRGLEQEVPINELLGIPRRPTNLQIMTNWMRPGGDNALMTGSSGRMIMNQFRQQQMMRQRQLDRAYRRAIARALQEADAEDLVDGRLRRAQDTTDWNRLASQLEDDLRQGRDKAPPERYRRAIEQYFRQVSGSDDRDTDAKP